MDDRKKWYAPDYAERMIDKGRKITLGCQVAKELGCKYLMAVDSDDLISNQIAKFVNEKGASPANWSKVDRIQISGVATQTEPPLFSHFRWVMP